jgi:hypothetical protein
MLGEHLLISFRNQLVFDQSNMTSAVNYLTSDGAQFALSGSNMVAARLGLAAWKSH